MKIRKQNSLHNHKIGREFKQIRTHRLKPHNKKWSHFATIWMFLLWHPLFHQTSIATTKKFEIENKYIINLILNSDTLSINQSHKNNHKIQTKRQKVRDTAYQAAQAKQETIENNILKEGGIYYAHCTNLCTIHKFKEIIFNHWMKDIDLYYSLPTLYFFPLNLSSTFLIHPIRPPPSSMSPFTCHNSNIKHT